VNEHVAPGTGSESESGSPIRRFFRSKLGRNFSGTLFWHGLARLVQIVGIAHASKCLGPDAVGTSGVVMTVATCLQQLLGLGFEIALVRHFTRDRTSSLELLPAVFTFRTVTALIGGAIWFIVAWFWKMPQADRWVWLWGAPNFIFLLLDYNWVFQAEERMPALTRIQLWITGISSLIYLVVFRPGQTPGSDLAVWGIVNFVVGVILWRDIRKRFKVPLWDLSKLGRAWLLVTEGRPVWLYNVTYWVHHTLQLPLVYFLLGPLPSGLYRSAAQLVMPAQAVIVFFLVTAYPRMIEWRQKDPRAYVKRIRMMAFGWFAAGWVAYAVVWVLCGPLYHYLYGKAFEKGAEILPILLLGKFVAAPNGMFLWALFADHKDWAGVKSVGPLLAVEIVVNYLAIPHLSLPSVAWLSIAGEAVLIVLTATAFHRATRGLLANKAG
jgi:O-antigen/teichoic acid export membrane protein